MPKRGAGRSNYDYHLAFSGRNRRIDKAETRKDHDKWHSAIRNHLHLEHDEDMGGGGRNQSSGRSGRGASGRGGGRVNKGKFKDRSKWRQNSPGPMRSLRRLNTSPSFWYKIIIQYGARYDKKWILESLVAAVAPMTFTPIYFELDGRDASFHVDDHKAAEKLMNMNRRISTTDGYKLGIHVVPSTPNSDLSDTVKDALKVTMNKRFNPDTNALNLSKLHADPDLVERFLVPLNRIPVLSAVMAMVVESCPALHALDLSHNMLFSLEALKSLVPRLSNLRILHIANNQINHIRHLEPLTGLDLEELLMDSNPICAKYNDQGAYVSDVRKKIPKLRKLDGVVLPPPILFDVEESQLPKTRGSFLCAEEGKEMARQFLEQYYALYDSGNREPLKDAYHENAMLSMTCNYLPGQSQPKQGQRDKLGAYMSYNRNLKRTLELDRRMRLLMCGHEEIIEFLSGLPNSQHDPLSFAVDLMLYTPQLIQLCVSGVFRETHTGNTAMRAFSRSLVIVPQGQGFCIVNETLFITNATSAQASAAFKSSLAPVAPAPTIVAPVVPLVPVPVAPIPASDIGMKRQMVEHLARTSGMNLGWSEKCLNETSWNLDQAVHVFTELHKRGTIPPEAFVK